MKYNVYRQWGTVSMASTDDVNEAWRIIGTLPFGEGYEVRAADGVCVDEFVPF